MSEPICDYSDQVEADLERQLVSARKRLSAADGLAAAVAERLRFWFLTDDSYDNNMRLALAAYHEASK